MGNFRSGRRRKRERVEDVPRLDALNYARAHNLPTLERQTPDAQAYWIGTCPKCAKGVRDVFQVESGVLCRKCAGLVYRRDSEHNSVADIVRRNPQVTGEAMETLKGAITTGNPAKYNEAMKVLNAAQNSPLDRLPSAQDAEAIVAAELQMRVIADDLQTSTALVEIIKAQIAAGMENTTNRRGEPLEIAMRGDTLAKLVAAWATVSNVRSNRMTQAAQILEKKAEGTHESIGEMMTKALIAAKHRTPDGILFEDLVNRANDDMPINYGRGDTPGEDF